MVKILISLLLFFASGFVLGRWTTPEPLSETETTFARFNGGVIQAREVLDVVDRQVNVASQQIYQAKLQVTIEKVKRRLLEITAQKENTTPEKILEKVRNQFLSEPVAKDEFNRFLNNQGVDGHKMSAQERDRYTILFRNIQTTLAENKFLERLSDAADVKIEIPGGQPAVASD